LDAHGSSYITGRTASSDFPIKNAFQKTLKGSQNAFVTKFDPAGCRLLYSTYLGGSFFDAGLSVAVDAHGDAYVTGSTLSTNFPTKHAFQATLKSSSGNAFVTKLDADGDSLVYSTYLGGSESSGSEVDFSGDLGDGIAVDRYGNAYITGITASPDFPTKNAFQPALGGPLSATNAFVTKLDVDGDALVYSTFLGGSGFFDRGSAIAVDAKGEAYITGVTSSSDFPTKHAFQHHLKGTRDAFVTKLCPAGLLAFSSYLGGTDDDHGNGIAVDAESNAYVTGFAASHDFPTKNAFQPMIGAPFATQNAFVTKISAQ